VNFWEGFIQPNKLIDSHRIKLLVIGAAGIVRYAQRSLDDEPRRAFFKKKNKKKKAGDYLMSRLLYSVFQALAEESEQYGAIQPAR